MDILSPEEKAIAEACREFEATAEVLDLREQLDNGLITSVEFAHKILCEWETFKRFPQYANLPLD